MCYFSLVAEDPVRVHAQLLAEARRMLAAAEKEAAKWRRLVKSIEGELAAEESFVLGEALTIASDNATVNTMNASATSDSLRSRAKLTKAARRHPFIAALVTRNETVAEAAAWLARRLNRKVPRSTVQAWYAPKSSPSYRAIPRDAAEALSEHMGVPVEAWSRIGD